MRKLKQRTSTSIVAEYLARVDDYVTLAQVKRDTRLDTNHASAALYHLKKFRAAECFESGGVLWWFATPQTDTRTKTLAERTPEARPRRQRRAAKKKVS